MPTKPKPVRSRRIEPKPVEPVEAMPAKPGPMRVSVSVKVKQGAGAARVTVSGAVPASYDLDKIPGNEADDNVKFELSGGDTATITVSI